MLWNEGHDANDENLAGNRCAGRRGRSDAPFRRCWRMKPLLNLEPSSQPVGDLRLDDGGEDLVSPGQGSRQADRTSPTTVSTISGRKRPPTTRMNQARKTPSSWTQTGTCTSCTSTVETTRSCTLSTSSGWNTAEVDGCMAVIAGTPTWSSMTTMNSTSLMAKARNSCISTTTAKIGTAVWSPPITVCTGWHT